MITDIALIAAEFAEENNYFFLTEYAAGANQALDEFELQDEKEFALWYNILERGNGAITPNARIVEFRREIEFNIMTKSDTKDDKGYNYYPKVQQCISRAIQLAKYLAKEVYELQSFTVESAIDVDDATLVGAKLTVIIIDQEVNC